MKITITRQSGDSRPYVREVTEIEIPDAEVISLIGAVVKEISKVKTEIYIPSSPLFVKQ